MSAFLLYHRSTSPTGRILARALGIPYGHLGPGQTQRRARSIQSSLSLSRAIIRWGSQQALPSGCQPALTLNSADALSRSSNKWTALTVLRQAGVLVPPFGRSFQDVKEASTTGVVLGRSCHGSKGQDICVFADSDPDSSESRNDFFTAYVPNTREYRIHVFKGEVIRTQGKYLDYPEQHTNPYIKNHSQGFRFRAPDRELNKDRYEAAINAVEALGLDFGAVDLIIGEDRKAYVLEANTAPACSPLTAEAYVRRFAEWLGKDPDECSERLRGAPVASQRVLVAV